MDLPVSRRKRLIEAKEGTLRREHDELAKIKARANARRGG